MIGGRLIGPLLSEKVRVCLDLADGYGDLGLWNHLWVWFQTSVEDANWDRLGGYPTHRGQANLEGT